MIPQNITVDEERQLMTARPSVTKRLIQNVGSNAAFLRFGFSSKTLRDGLANWFDFEGNLNSANGATNLTTFGSVTASYVSGRVGNCFSKTNDALGGLRGTGNEAHFSNFKESSAAFWYSIVDTGISNDNEQIMFDVQSANNHHYGLRYLKDTGQVVLHYDIDGGNVIQVPMATIAYNALNFYAVTRSPSGLLTGYVNGLQKAVIQDPKIGQPIDSAFFGVNGNTDAYHRFRLDSAGFYRRELSPAEIQMLYNGSNGKNYSGLSATNNTLYNVKLGANELIDVSWFNGNIYASASDVGTSTTLIVTDL